MYMTMSVNDKLKNILRNVVVITILVVIFNNYPTAAVAMQSILTRNYRRHAEG